MYNVKVPVYDQRVCSPYNMTNLNDELYQLTKRTKTTDILITWYRKFRRKLWVNVEDVV